ncbi:hypothetical protein O6H91_03G038200 [Diphasiastrum complanatum]|uniref:Uncharacterized protein n=4 Tax=Diphasiastrum complanatum TaxID=34168 RepID=A0ACC2E5E4_DIPCM|nr:hypothetical protein O6H91_03G038200 [Diphasiastrum complanatum]KAJ7561701.1 hypothetical protein O6H91_03G038200 [Diphasiastrum complanatum]KAJ7561702.1 hypothetical protein O6H91_03G038200 [Diphasiastrum complanatum]KAJ7561711.1 hypothetical protein O6H91_03G038200 [Diphasiastrum complanatum]
MSMCMGMGHAVRTTTVLLRGRILLLRQQQQQRNCVLKLGSSKGGPASCFARSKSSKFGHRSYSLGHQFPLLSALKSTVAACSLPASDLVLLSTKECRDGSILYKFGSPEEHQSEDITEKDEKFSSSLESDGLRNENSHDNFEKECSAKAVPDSQIHQPGSFSNSTELNENQEMEYAMGCLQELQGTGTSRNTIVLKKSSEESLILSPDELQFHNSSINSKSAISEHQSSSNAARECAYIDKGELQSSLVAKEQTSIKTEQVSPFNMVQAVESLDVAGTRLDNAVSDGDSKHAFGKEVATGGEDAFFIEGSSWVGIADGVGAWTFSGIDSGHYARELMWNCAEIARGYLGKPNPKAVLEKAFRKTKATGSSTTLIAALYKQTLFAVNVGDSGFLLIRSKEVVAKSIPMQHAFNFPYQIGLQSDHPSVGEPYELPVSEGDVLVLGTDGLFDNLFENEIVKIVIANLQSGGGPELAAKMLVQSAQILAARQEGRTPFAEAAAAARINYLGGKLDDVTAIVSYVT